MNPLTFWVVTDSDDCVEGGTTVDTIGVFSTENQAAQWAADLQHRWPRRFFFVEGPFSLNQQVPPRYDNPPTGAPTP